TCALPISQDRPALAPRSVRNGECSSDRSRTRCTHRPCTSSTSDTSLPLRPSRHCRLTLTGQTGQQTHHVESLRVASTTWSGASWRRSTGASGSCLSRWASTAHKGGQRVLGRTSGLLLGLEHLEHCVVHCGALLPLLDELTHLGEGVYWVDHALLRHRKD